MHKALLTLVTFAVLLLSVPARAQVGGGYQPLVNDAWSYDVVSGCSDIDSCIWSGDDASATSVPTCTRSVCWFCRSRLGSLPASECGQTGATVDGPMGCSCGVSPNTGECALGKSKCSIG